MQERSESPRTDAGQDIGRARSAAPLIGASISPPATPAPARARAEREAVHEAPTEPPTGAVCPLPLHGALRRRELLFLTAVLFLWLFLSRLSALASGAALPTVALLLRLTAYLLPAVLCLSRQRRTVPMAVDRPLLPTARDVRRVLPLLPLFLSSVMLLSTLTEALMRAAALPVVGGGAGARGFWPDLFWNACLPAFLEECLLRAGMLPLLERSLGRAAIPTGALLFALMHASLYQLPYAFVGGIFLSLAALLGRSWLFALLFHFVNNAFSLLLQYLPQWAGEAAMPLLLTVALLLFAAAAGAFLFFRREREGGLRALLSPQREWWQGTARAFSSPLALWALTMLLLTFL